MNGVPARCRRATDRATERNKFYAKGPPQTAAATRRNSNTGRHGIMAAGRGGGNEREASEAAGGAAPRSNVERHSGASEARTPKG